MNGKSVLLVDDEKSILKTLSFNLSKQGYKVETASSGEEGIEKFKRIEPDLVVTDLMMEGIDGIQVLETVKRIKRDTMVIVLTGYGSMNTVLKALRLGAYDYLQKPCDRSELSLKVANCLEKQDLARRVDSLTLDLVTANSQLMGKMEVIRQNEKKLKYYAKELERSNKDLESFAGIASHDLQEPLIKILRFSELILDSDTKKSDKERDYLERMNKAAERMITLIDDLLDLSRVMSEGNPFETVNLNELVREVLDDLEIRISESKATVKLDDLPALKVDASQIRRLFQNLIGNALKFNKKGEPPRVEVTCDLSADGYWRIRIIDNGIGFDEEHVSRIFKPFERLHGRSQYEGTGMGLAISKRIAERHGGTLSASSIKGEGSVFTISLPAK